MKEVAKKTLEMIDKEQAKLDSMIAKREEFTAGYQAKLSEMNETIKKQERVIASLREREKSEKLSAVASLMGAKGISVDDLLKAAESGDLYGIQEMIENKAAKPALVSPAENPTPAYAGDETNTDFGGYNA